MRIKQLSIALISLAAAGSCGVTMAADIKLIASPGVRAVVNELAPQFEKATGHKVMAGFDVIAVLKRRIDGGEAFDIVIPSPEVIDELIREGKVASDSKAAFGRTGVALGVRKGAPKPDISTPENLKKVLLQAKVVGHSREGQTGIAFLEALKRLGIMDEMRPKLCPMTTEEQAAAMQKGELDIAASGMGVIMEMPGADFLGPLPPGLQGYVRFTAGVSAASKAPEAARDLVKFMTSPSAEAAFKAKGMERD
jgi:molybdate transport system substrate-binding protein